MPTPPVFIVLYLVYLYCDIYVLSRLSCSTLFTVPKALESTFSFLSRWNQTLHLPRDTVAYKHARQGLPSKTHMLKLTWLLIKYIAVLLSVALSPVCLGLFVLMWCWPVLLIAWLLPVYTNLYISSLFGFVKISTVRLCCMAVLLYYSVLPWYSTLIGWIPILLNTKSFLP